MIYKWKFLIRKVSCSVVVVFFLPFTENLQTPRFDFNENVNLGPVYTLFLKSSTDGYCYANKADKNYNNYNIVELDMSAGNEMEEDVKISGP